ETGRRGREGGAGGAGAGGEVAEAEQEGDQKDADARAVGVDERVEPAQPVDLVRLAAARVRPGRGRQRAADNQREARRREDDSEPAQLERYERLDPPDLRGA